MKRCAPLFLTLVVVLVLVSPAIAQDADAQKPCSSPHARDSRLQAIRTECLLGETAGLLISLDPGPESSEQFVRVSEVRLRFLGGLEECEHVGEKPRVARTLALDQGRSLIGWKLEGLREDPVGPPQPIPVRLSHSRLSSRGAARRRYRCVRARVQSRSTVRRLT